MTKMRYESRDESPPEREWFAICLTFLGAVLGPLASLSLILTLPYEWAVLGLYFFFSIPIAVGFLLGVIGGHWLGKTLDRLIGCRKRGTNRFE
jgi:hypothetical protein